VFLYKLNCIFFDREPSAHIILQIKQNVFVVGGDDNEIETQRLINLYLFNSNQECLKDYVAVIYGCTTNFEKRKLFKKLSNDMERLGSINFLRFDCIKNVQESNYNMFYMYVTYSILHSLSESDFKAFSKIIGGDHVVVDSSVIRGTKLTLQSVVGSITKKILLFVDILIMCGFVSGYIDERCVYKYIYYIINMLRVESINKKPIIKINKIIIKNSRGITYSNVVLHYIKIKQSIEGYINVFFVKPDVISKNNITLCCPCFVLYAIRPIKQIKVKKPTVVCGSFLDTIAKVMSTKYYVDIDMLNKVSTFTEKQLCLIKNSMLEVTKKAVGIKLDDVFLDGEISNFELSDIDKLFNTVVNKMAAENTTENKRLINIVLEDINFNKKMLNTINKMVLTFNKKNNLSVRGLNSIDNFDSFFLKNKNIFLKGRITASGAVCGSCEAYKNITTKKLILDLAWCEVKATQGGEYKKYTDKISELKDIRSNIDKISSNIAAINYFKDFYKFVVDSNIKYFYFLIFTDARGRIYVKSPVSIQANWLYRYLYHFGDVDYDDYCKNVPIIKNNITNEQLGGLLQELGNIGIHDLNTLNIFFSIGIIFKSKILDVGGLRSLYDTIKYGIHIYIKTKESVSYLDDICDIDDKLSTVYYIHIIENIKVKNIKRWYIIKDTTASVSQHSAKLLGCRVGALKYLNLDSDCSGYFDTYEIFKIKLIDHLKNKTNNNKLINLLSRGVLKKIIMTISYSIGSKSAYEDWLQTVDALNISAGDKGVLVGGFYKIFNFLKDDSVGKDILFIKTKADFLKRIKSLEYFNLDDIQIPIKYYGVKTEDIKYQFCKKITTISYNYADFTTEDEVKTNISAFVNCIHALDSRYLRRIIRACYIYNIPIAPIHDGFCVPFFNCDALVYIARENFMIDEVKYVFGDINKDISNKQLSEFIIV